MTGVHVIQTGKATVRKRGFWGKGHGMMARLIDAYFDKTLAEVPIYAWVIEHPEGIIVVDTGQTARASDPNYVQWMFRWALKFSVEPKEEVGPQLEALGIKPNEVRLVILTHLHGDHVGGLSYFPKAEIVVSRKEYARARSFMGRRLYLPERWPTWFSPRLLDLERKPVGPFPESLSITRAEDVRLVGTEGHSAGHVSVMLHQGEATLFFAGDASYTQQLMLEQVVEGIPADERKASQTLQRILTYVREVPTVYLPSHDPSSVERLAARSVATPVPIAATATSS